MNQWWGERTLNLETGLADRKASENVMDEICERAIEVALSYADHAPASEVVVLLMGPEPAYATLRKGLAMGASSAIQVVDDALLGADLTLTAEVVAAVLTRIGCNLVVSGDASTDGGGGVLPSLIAERLDLPHLTSLSAVEITEDQVRGTRLGDAGSMTVSAPLPALVSITEALPDARFPNFKGIMAAKKKSFETLSLSDLGIVADDRHAARSIVLGISKKPPREAGVKIVDEGDAGEQLAAFLKSNQLV